MGVTTRLLPPPVSKIDPREPYDVERIAPGDRPYVVLNMVASVDGATALDGVTKALGSRTDHTIFHHLRGLADAVMAGASTVRAERYGRVHLPPEAQRERAARGQVPEPPLVVVSRSLVFDWDGRPFRDAGARPILLLPEDADPAGRARAAEFADVYAIGNGSVDLAGALRQLRSDGVGLLLCEGGPSLNAELVHHDLVDELCLTVSPQLVLAASLQGVVRRAEGGVGRAEGGAPVPLELAHILEEESFLYLRFLVRRR